MKSDSLNDKSKAIQLSMFDDDYDNLLDTLIQHIPTSEFEEVEYKSGAGGFPNELWKTYSAFANTNSGLIVIGVKEKNNLFTIEGLTDEQINKYKQQFWNECNNPNKVNRNLLSNDDIKVVEWNAKQVLVIKVPFASRTERPVYLTKNPFSNTYKRNHEGDYRCTDEEVKRMLADASTELKKDAFILEHFTLDDIDATSLKQYRQLFASQRPGHPWLVEDDITLLKKLGGYRIDRATKKEGLTIAGLLMFGKYDSIKEQEAIGDFFPDFRENTSEDENIRWTDRIYPDGSWESNLFQFYLKVWPKLSSTLPKPFRLENDTRIDESPTHIALREAFVNALVHTDYSLSGNIVINLNTEQFKFSNPGTLLVSLQQYYEGGISECRNPALQQMFMLIGRAEKAGSGVDKILSGWKESHWRKPFIEVTNQPDRITLTLPMFSVLPQKVLTALNETYKEGVQHLSPDELTVLAFCQIEGAISNQRLQYALNMHSADITKLLKKLVEEHYLESNNNGRWTIYKLSQKVDTFDKVTTSKVDTSAEKVATSKKSKDTDNQVKRSEEVATSKVDTSKKVATSKVDTSKKVATSKVDTSEKVDTSKVDTPKKLKKEELEQLIIELCKDEYQKMELIAKKINRSFDYLKNKIFPTMVKDKKLEKKYPFTDNHPEQAYKTTKEYAK